MSDFNELNKIFIVKCLKCDRMLTEIIINPIECQQNSTTDFFAFWIAMASNSNSSWLEAYEAQKAKALQKIQSKKNGENVTGLSGISGVVNSKEVSEFSKKTQVTKLLSNLKKPEQPKPQKRESQTTPVSETKPEKIPKMSKNNSLHQAIDQQKLMSIQAFQSNPAASNNSPTKAKGTYKPFIQKI